MEWSEREERALLFCAQCCGLQELVTANTIATRVESVVPGTAAGGRSGAWSTGEVARPLPALSHCAGFAPSRLPLVLLLAEHLAVERRDPLVVFTTH